MPNYDFDREMGLAELHRRVCPPAWYERLWRWFLQLRKPDYQRIAEMEYVLGFSRTRQTCPACGHMSEPYKVHCPSCNAGYGVNGIVRHGPIRLYHPELGAVEFTY